MAMENILRITGKNAGADVAIPALVRSRPVIALCMTIRNIVARKPR